MVVAIYPLERTRDRGTARRELLLCDMQYVLSSVNICSYLLSHFDYIKISTYDTYVHDAPIETSFWEDFTEVEGTYI